MSWIQSSSGQINKVFSLGLGVRHVLILIMIALVTMIFPKLKKQVVVAVVAVVVVVLLLRTTVASTATALNCP